MTRRLHDARSSASVVRPRALAAACIIALSVAACARPMPEWDVMSMPPLCDSIPLPLKPGEPIGATLPEAVRPSSDSGTAVGTVTEAGTDRTLGGAAIAFRPLPPSDSTRRPTRRARTTRSGGFEVRALVPGRYQFRITGIGHRPHEREVDVRAGVIDTFAVQLGAYRCSGI